MSPFRICFALAVVAATIAAGLGLRIAIHGEIGLAARPYGLIGGLVVGALFLFIVGSVMEAEL